MSNPITITLSEWQIIEHRLSLPDALAEVLSETFDWKFEECEEKARTLYRTLSFQFIAAGRITVDLAAMDEIDRELLKDTLNGSTYFCGFDDAIALKETTRGTFLSAERAAQSLESKFRSAGHRVFIPRD